MFFTLKNRFLLALTCGVVLAAAGCESSSPSFPAMSSPVGGASDRMVSPEASAAPAMASRSRVRLEERPGLGTELGSNQYDPVRQSAFFRKNRYQPDFVGQFFYNDREGAKTMAEMAGNPRSRGGSFNLNNGALGVRVRSKGGACPYYEANGRIIVMGEAGAEYEIELSNKTGRRIEAVVSVDGLDTMTGGPASFAKRGYLIGKRESYSVRGFRQGSSVRSFRFSSVASSQAALRGGERGARNVGVIGIAVYEEDEAAAHQSRLREGSLRTDARPF